MLALSRKEGETILVGEFEIVVLQVGVDVVQLRVSLVRDAENVVIEFWSAEGEEFRIGKSIVGRIASVRNQSIGIAIEAPLDVSILRGEIVGKMPTPPIRNGGSRAERRDRFPGIH
ncbi:MAG: Global regulator protein family [Pseudomonadota bacterium]|jgi:sRNA-binding carbon storage regulator CsrA